MVDPHKAPMCASVCPLSDDPTLVRSSHPGQSTIHAIRCEGLKELHQKQAENPTVYCAHVGLNLDPYTYFEIKLYLHENHFKLHKYPEQIHLENCAFWAGFSLRSVCPPSLIICGWEAAPPDQTIPFDWFPCRGKFCTLLLARVVLSRLLTVALWNVPTHHTHNGNNVYEAILS